MAAQPFDPDRSRGERVVEPRDAYIRRMQEGPLPNWPAEVLGEWLYRHAGHICRYAFLGFHAFHFRRETWLTERVPGQEAFLDPTAWGDSYESVLARAAARNDWLASFMLEHGTWNTPIVLLENITGLEMPNGLPLGSPFHLLEGHRRLAYFNGLRSAGQLAGEHDVWIVSTDEDYA